MENVIREKLLDFIVRNFLVEREEIDLEKSLVDEGIIDSFGLIEIAAFIEDEYAIRVEDSDKHRDNFGSVLKIADFINRKMNQAGAS